MYDDEWKRNHYVKFVERYRHVSENFEDGSCIHLVSDSDEGRLPVSPNKVRK